MCQHHGRDQTSTLPFEFKTHKSIKSYGIAYAVEESLKSYDVRWPLKNITTLVYKSGEDHNYFL